jgi:ribonuclease T2
MRSDWFRLTLAVLAATAALSGAPPKKGGGNKPGVFDYYVLSLSWSPQHCSNHNDSPQCDKGRRFGFVVHGLWPQFERGYPSNCRGPAGVPDPVVKEMMEIMPSRQLIRHEWQKHGTCSGLDVKGYFQKTEDAYVLVKIPPELKQPLKNVETTAAKVKRAFVNANPGFERSFAVLCGGRFLREVRVCYTKDLEPRPCASDVRDQCRSGSIIMRPVR